SRSSTYKPASSQQLLVGMELAIFAGVVEGHVRVGPLLAQIDFTGVEGLGIDVNADRALVEFGEIEHLVHRLQRIHVRGMHPIHFVDFGLDELAGAGMVAGGLAILYTKILHFQASYRSRHPAILIAMVVDSTELADFPTDRHALEHVVLENQVARVAAF